jgi:hypothetical protein
MLFGLGTNYSLAGEKVKLKATATSVNTKWHEIEVGDEEGHVIAVLQNTQAWVSDITGERSTQFSRATMDLHKKTGQGTMQGYGVMTYSNGDKRFNKWEGKLVGKGIWKGTFTDIGGTGKYEGCTGGGTWESKSLGPGISQVVAEGERTFK